MRGLTIDTALGLCSVVVFDDGGVVASRAEAMTKGHSERLGGLVRDVMAEAGEGFGSLTRIGVVVGPGSFTGLRVGLAFALGLGAALDRPVVGLSALDALAASAPEGRPDDVAALIDARRGQVYARFWTGGMATGPAEALSIEAAQERVRDLVGPRLLIGSGAALIQDTGSDIGVLPLAGPSAQALAHLTRQADPVLSPARPLYLRAPDATPPTRLPGQARPERL